MVGSIARAVMPAVVTVILLLTILFVVYGISWLLEFKI